MSSSCGVGLHVFLFHAGGFALYAGNFIYENNYIVTPGARTYGGKWKYLTHWNETIQLLYFMWATLIDVYSMVTKPKKRNILIHGSRDLLFSTFAFPMAMIVCLIFWSIYAVDREMIFPVFLDKIIPSLVNHILHTFSSILMVLEALIIHHHYPTRRTGLVAIFSVSSLYFLWMGWQRHVLSQWPYPFLETFTLPQFCVFYLTCCGLLCLFYFIGQHITAVWFNEPRKSKNKA